jgi:endo-beta-N-acetylglucosaminidase D
LLPAETDNDSMIEEIADTIPAGEKSRQNENKKEIPSNNENEKTFNTPSELLDAGANAALDDVLNQHSSQKKVKRKREMTGYH